MLISRVRPFTRPLLSSMNKSHCVCSTPFANPRRIHGVRFYSNTSNGSRRRTTWQSLVALFKQSPILVPTAFILMLISSGILLWTNKYYSDYILGAFHTFPEPVAKQLRKALFHTNVELKPTLALKYYKEAIRVAEELGMDRFSDEMIGIKVQIGLLFEKCERYHKAIEILESIRTDNMKWLEVVGLRDDWYAKRNKVLQKTIQISVKLGDLYSNSYVLEQELAEERITWAVEETLREQQRREKEGIKEGEGPWFNDEEIGAQFETLAHIHEEKNRHYLSTPLFLQALNLSPPQSCHTVILMNNLSASIAQQLPPSNFPVNPATRETLITNAAAWANSAISLSEKIKAPERNWECDEGCAVATHNLGEYAEMRGDLVTAKRKYEEAAQLAKNIRFKSGMKKAKMALKRIDELIKESKMQDQAEN